MWNNESGLRSFLPKMWRSTSINAERVTASINAKHTHSK
jgi:hypothetical protein